MKRVYIAGPYSKGDVAANVSRAIQASDIIGSLGMAPYCPHLSHFWHLQRQRPYEFWMDLGLSWVPQCDALFRLPGESPGSDREVEKAKSLGIPVFTSLVALYDWSCSK